MNLTGDLTSWNRNMFWTNQVTEQKYCGIFPFQFVSCDVLSKYTFSLAEEKKEEKKKEESEEESDDDMGFGMYLPN